MQQDRPREDLTCAWPGEIGLGLLVVAHGIRKGDYSVSAHLHVQDLIEQLEKLICRLEILEDPVPYEIEMPKRLYRVQKYLRELEEKFTAARLPPKPILPKTKTAKHDGQAPSLDADTGLLHAMMDPEAFLRKEKEREEKVKAAISQIAHDLEQFGESLYTDRFDFRKQPSTVREIVKDLEELEESVKVYGPSSRIVTIHAEETAGCMTAMLAPDSGAWPHDTLEPFRDRVLAAKTFLEEIASHDRRECEEYLSRTLTLFRGMEHEHRERHSEEQQAMKTSSGQKRWDKDNALLFELMGELGPIFDNCLRSVWEHCGQLSTHSLSSVEEQADAEIRMDMAGRPPLHGLTIREHALLEDSPLDLYARSEHLYSTIERDALRRTATEAVSIILSWQDDLDKVLTTSEVHQAVSTIRGLGALFEELTRRYHQTRRERARRKKPANKRETETPAPSKRLTAKNRSGDGRVLRVEGAEILFDDKPLPLPTGRTTKVCIRLIKRIERLVTYKSLGCNAKEADDQTRQAVCSIRKVLKAGKLPYEVETIKWRGFRLKKKIRSRQMRRR